MNVTQQQAREAFEAKGLDLISDGDEAAHTIGQFIEQHPDTQGAQYEGNYPLRAEVWFRSSTNEWVLEISGAINGTDLISRHTEPATTKPEDVPGLPTRYAHSSPDTGLREALGKLAEELARGCESPEGVHYKAGHCHVVYSVVRKLRALLAAHPETKK